MYQEYIKRIAEANSIAVLNDIVEEAANDETITNTEYQEVYDAALQAIRTAEI